MVGEREAIPVPTDSAFHLQMEIGMSQQTHVQALNDKHATMERLIAEETNRPSPDQLKLTKLKREKLKLKEEIARLSDLLASPAG